MRTKKISKYQRISNIIQNAINNGFTFDENAPLKNIRESAEVFLERTTEPIYVKCEVYLGRYILWDDGEGFVIESWGDDINSRLTNNNNLKSPNTKIFHTSVFNSKGEYVRLYELVGENEFNVPEGFYYDTTYGYHSMIMDNDLPF